MDNMQKYEEQILVTLTTGLHARPAGILVKVASQYQAKIELEKNGVKKNAKSIMSVLSLGAVNGDQLRVLAEGDDAHLAGPAIIALFSSGFQTETPH